MTLSIVLVDDNHSFRGAVQVFLGTLPGVEVVGCAHNGREALEQVARLHPDLVLLDIVMPEMDGFETMRKLKAAQHPPRIVFLSLHDNAAYRTLAANIGADGFVSKAELNERLPGLLTSLGAGKTGGEREPRMTHESWNQGQETP